MKTLKVTIVSLAAAAAVVVSLTTLHASGQEFSTPDGDLSPTISVDLPSDAQGCMVWSDAESAATMPDPHVRAKARDESLAWVRRVIQDKYLLESPAVSSATVSIVRDREQQPTLYDGTRMKFRVRGGSLFVTQTAGKMCVVFHPDPGSRGAKNNSPQELRTYLEDTVKRLFKHAPAMLYLAREEPFPRGFSLGLDLGRALAAPDEVAAEVHRLAPELEYPLTGGVHTYYWGGFFFCTDGLDVVATFNKVQGGGRFNIDRPRW